MTRCTHGRPVTPGSAPVLPGHAPEGGELVTWQDADGQIRETTPDEMPDDLGQVGDHHNDLGDWCPYSGAHTADGTCPLYCHEADVQAGFDAGDRMLPASTDLDPELYETDETGTRWAVHPSPARCVPADSGPVS
jgi:hypothetical protein